MTSGPQIILVTGFLGAGKTTFLKKRLQMDTLKTGVLVNDFGKINFDGLSLAREGLDLIELSNGSIFCSCLKDRFIDGLVDLIGRDLDQIYIESSGLADPSEMTKILSLVQFKAVGHPFENRGTVCLVDAQLFPRVLPKMLSVERQIRHSHLIVINKRDLVDDEQLAQIIDTIRTLNTQAKITSTSYGDLDSEAFQYDVFAIADEATTNKIETRNKSLILHLLAEPDANEFRSFLESLGDSFHRIKGLVQLDGQLIQVDQVGGQLQMRPANLACSANPVNPVGSTSPMSLAVNQLVCLTSRGLDSIAYLAREADQRLPGLFRLEM